jgi:DNA-binding HxlR family transcriptional regulator
MGVPYGMRDMVPHGEGPICRHFQRAAELVGQRWVPQVIYALHGGRAMRYRELKATIPAISDALLSDRLKDLEAARIITRDVEPSTPVRITYALTERGGELAAVLGELQIWAERWSKEPAAR